LNRHNEKVALLGEVLGGCFADLQVIRKMAVSVALSRD
jgi:hypothetical protein